MAATALRLSAVKGSCSLRGPRRGERRSTMRTTVAGGVSSPKRGRNGCGLNSYDGSYAPVVRRGHKDEGERAGVLARLVKERNGRGRKCAAATGDAFYNGLVEGARGRLAERGRVV
jgi:hypothetical protein